VQILLSNDDGIHAPGLSALYPELKRLGNVQIERRLRSRAASPSRSRIATR